MKFELRPYNPETDYPLFSDWWTRHKFPPPPAAVLPPRNAVALLDGSPVACCWAYFSESDRIAMIEWAVTNPDVSPRVTYEALRQILRYLPWVLRKHGAQYIIAATSVKGLIKLFEKSGFKKTDEQVTHLVYKGV